MFILPRCFNHFFLKKQFRVGQKKNFIVWSGLRRTEILLTNVLQQRNLDQISISPLATIAINSDAARYMGKIFFIETTGTTEDGRSTSVLSL